MTEASAPASGTPGAGRPVYLHIGMMKTGTSYVQAVLMRNLDLLARRGILYPVDETRWGLQVRAARDVLDIRGARPSDGMWQAVLDQVHSHRGSATVYSMEFLSFADEAQARRIVTDLGVDVQVIVTARDIERVLPSAWQSMVKQGHPWPFDVFVRSVTGATDVDPEPGIRFWRHHDLARIVGIWSSVVGSDRVHIVTVPPSGAAPDALWARFTGALDLDPEGFDTTQDRNSNFSLSYSDTELVRQIHLALDGRLSRLAQKRWAARYLANRVLRAGAGADTADDRPTLGPELLDWTVATSRRMVADLRELGVRVHGDLDELLVHPRPDTGPPAEPSRPYPVRAAEVIAEMLVRLALVDPQMPDGGGPETPGSRLAPAGEPATDDDDFGWDDDHSPRALEASAR